MATPICLSQSDEVHVWVRGQVSLTKLKCCKEWHVSLKEGRPVCLKQIKKKKKKMKPGFTLSVGGAMSRLISRWLPRLGPLIALSWINPY